MKVKKTTKIHYDEPIPVYDVLNAGKLHNFVVAAGSTNIIAHNCVLDETNFAKSGVKDINKAKQHMKNLYDTANARISGSFRISGEVYGKLIASSSKNQDNDFLSDYIEQQQNAGNTHLYVVDEPQWKILPPEMFSKEVFHFTVGDRFKRGFVINEAEDDEEHRQEYIRQGYKVMEAPAELRTNFLADYDIALRDIAGISVAGAMGFITQEQVTPNLSKDRHNPFYTDVIQVGTQDNSTIEEYFHLDVVWKNLISRLMNIHLDLSETGDRTGICGVCVDGSKIVTDFEGRKIEMPFFREIFSIGIEAPRGDRLSFQKVVNFILWLRRQGFNIGTISTDQYQSSYLRELLTAQGFRTDKISVDRSEDPYMGLRNILNDQRIELVRNDLRDNELIHLQRINNRIDHPPNGCFTDDTKIRLVDGRSLSIRDLLIEQSYGKTNWVYTFNHDTQRIEPKKIRKVFQTKITSSLVKVYLDDGSSVLCTPEHPFMLRDGSFDQAQNLTSGTSLMPLYTRVSNKGLHGYRMYYEPIEDRWHHEHRFFCNSVIRKPGYVVHHKNYDSKDNCPSNLVCLTISEHRTIHNNHTLDYTKTSASVRNWHSKKRNSKEYQERSAKISQSVIASMMRNGTWESAQLKKKQQAERISKIEKMFDVKWDHLSTEEHVTYGLRYSAATEDPEVRRNRYIQSMAKRDPDSELLRRQHVSESTRNRRWYTDGVNNVYIDKSEDAPIGFRPGRTLSAAILENIRVSHQHVSEELRKKHSIDTSNRIWVTDGTCDRYISKDSPIPEGFRRGRCKVGKNHKVDHVEYIHEPCKVYDIEVEDNHNFALDIGVFVHNSKDIADCLCGATWTLTTEHVTPTPPPSRIASAVAAVNGPRSRFGNNGTLPGFNMFPGINRR